MFALGEEGWPFGVNFTASMIKEKPFKCFMQM